MSPPDAASPMPRERLRGDGVARAIENDIAQGKLVAGSWLKQIDLEAEYGVPRSDVRYALERLAERGFVEHIINRGYRVNRLTQEALHELIEIRALLEVEACADAPKRLTAEETAALEQAARGFEHAVTHGTVEEQEAANLHFHGLLLASSRNREMVKLVLELRQRERLGLVLRRSSAALLARDVVEHFTLVECIRRGDTAQFRRLLRSHILSAKQIR